MSGVDRNQPANRDEARRLTDAATPGPWKTDKWSGGAYFVGRVPGGRPGGEVIGDTRPSVQFMPGYSIADQHANAEFIVAARSLVPALLDELDAAGAERDQLRTELAEAKNRYCAEFAKHAVTMHELAEANAHIESKAEAIESHHMAIEQRLRHKLTQAEREAAGLRAQVQAEGAKALREAADAIPTDPWAKWATAHNQGKDYPVRYPVAEWLRARAAALVPTNPEPAEDHGWRFEDRPDDPGHVTLTVGPHRYRVRRDPLPVGVLTDQPDPETTT